MLQTTEAWRSPLFSAFQKCSVDCNDSCWLPIGSPFHFCCIPSQYISWDDYFSSLVLWTCTSSKNEVNRQQMGNYETLFAMLKWKILRGKWKTQVEQWMLWDPWWQQDAKQDLMWVPQLYALNKLQVPSPEVTNVTAPCSQQSSGGQPKDCWQVLQSESSWRASGC